MDPSFLFALACALFVITIIGHGFWLAVAWVFRQLVGSEQKTAQPTTTRCPHCGHPHSFQQNRCGYCGYAPSAAAADPNHELSVAARVMQQMVQHGTLTAKQLEQFSTALRSEHQRRSGAPFTAADVQSVLGPQVEKPPILETPLVESESAAQGSLASSVAVPPIAVPDDQGAAEEESAVVAELAAAAAPAQRKTPVPAPVSDKARRSATLSDMLHAFMEEKNIRWGELISGMLIVGCATGLVISLHETIQRLSDQIPYFPALLFMLVTAAVHGAGIYTLRRWNLRTTSQGVLVIALLLIPLNFLAAIVLAGTGETQLSATSPWYMSAVAIGLISFGTMTYFSSRAMTVDAWWRIFVAIMVPSIGQLIINRWTDSRADVSALGPATALAVLPAAGYLVAVVAQLLSLTGLQHLTPRRVRQTYLVAGIALFSLAAAAGLLLTRAMNRWDMAAALSPLMVCVAATILAVGLVLHQRIRQVSRAATRTTGTALVILAAICMVAAIFFAWPRPVTLIVLAGVNMVLLTGLAVMGRLPALHFPAVASVGLGVLVGFHVIDGAFEDLTLVSSSQLTDALLMGRSSLVLVGLAVLLAGAAAGWHRLRMPRAGESYAISSLLAAAAAIAIALYSGFWTGVDGDLATLVFAALAAGLLAAGILRREAAVAIAGSTALLVALIHALGWNEWVGGQLQDWERLLARPVLHSLLAHGVLVSLLALLARRVAGWQVPDVVRVSRRSVVEGLSATAVVTTLCALLPVVSDAGSAFSHHSQYALLLAVTWLLLTITLGTPWTLAGFQLTVSLAIGFAVAAWVQQREWSVQPLSDPRHWFLQITMIMMWAAVWPAMRCFDWSGRWIRPLRWPRFPTVDELLVGVGLTTALAASVQLVYLPALFELGMVDSVSQPVDAILPYCWAAVGVLVLASLAMLVEKVRSAVIFGFAVISVLIPLLVAGHFHSSLAVASALRWSFALCLLVVGGAIAGRARIRQLLAKFPWIQMDAHSQQATAGVGAFVTGLATVMVVGLTTLMAVQAASGNALHGPTAGTLFDRMGITVSTAVPMFLVVAGYLGMTVALKRMEFAALGAVLFQYLIGLLVVLPALVAGRAWNDQLTGQLLQWSVVGLGLFGLVWRVIVLGLQRSTEGDALSKLDRGMLSVHLFIGQLTLGVMAGGVFIALFLSPQQIWPMAQTVGQWPSFLATGLILAATAAACWPRFQETAVHLLVAGSVVAATFLAASLEAWGTAGEWVGYHSLLVAWSLIGVLCVVVVGALPAISTDGKQDTVRRSLVRWTWFTSFVVVLLALRAYPSDVETPWWTFGSLIAVTVGLVCLGMLQRARGYGRWALVLVALNCGLMQWRFQTGIGGEWIWDFLHWNLTSMLAAAMTWLAIELVHQRYSEDSFDRRGDLMSPQRLVAVAACGFLLLFDAGGFAYNTLSAAAGGAAPFPIDRLSVYVCLAATVLCTLAALWDREALYAPLCLYTLVLIALAVALETAAPVWNLPPLTVLAATAIGLAAWHAATGHLWRWGLNLARWGLSLGMPRPVERLEHTSRWLPRINNLLAVVVMAVGVGVVLSADDRGARMAAAVAPALLAYGFFCLAQDARQHLMRTASLLAVAFSAVLIGWADIQPNADAATLLQRAFRMLMVASLGTVVYGVLLPRWLAGWPDWKTAIRWSTRCTLFAAAGLLAMVLTLEAVLFVPGQGAPVAAAQIVAVAVLLVLLVVGLLVMALSPKHDPLQLSESGRAGYVYAGQAVAALLFGHVYLGRPELFHGVIGEYWPYVVLVIAFAGVGFGELFRRQQLNVLGNPFQTTAGFLPLIPVLGFWVIESQRSDLTLLLFSTGLVYVFLSMTRRSVLSITAAALAGNAAFWSLLHDTGFELLAQPQFWLIPPAVSVLVAAQLNRHRLNEGQLTAVRYPCLIVIYLSSAGETFLVGVGEGFEHLLRPMILAGLSVVGVMSGIALRIRAFLYTGASFLLLSIITMVWHASTFAQHSWPWWVFGIGLGLAILTMFVIFEKRRDDILHLADRLRQWQH